MTRSDRGPPTWPTMPSSAWPPADPYVLRDLWHSLREASSWCAIGQQVDTMWHELYVSSEELWIEIMGLPGVDMGAYSTYAT